MSITSTPLRAYRGRTSAMLTGIAAITESAIAHAAELQDADSSFSVSYFQDLRLRIESATREVLGADNAAELRAATIDVRATAETAYKELSLTRTWIESKYAATPVRRDELLNNLGFSRFYRSAVTQRQHEDLGQLLGRLSTGLDSLLSQEFINAGLPAARIRSIHELAATFQGKNVHQETQKGQRKERTAEDLSTLNSLYAEVMGISKLARKLFSDRPAIQSTFAYETVVPAVRSRKPDAPPAGKA